MKELTLIVSAILAATFLMSLYGIGLAVYYKTVEHNSIFTILFTILSFTSCTVFFSIVLKLFLK